MGTGSKFSETIKSIRVTYGERAIGRSDVLSRQDKRVPTGSVALDRSFGGGMRVGSVAMFYGEKSGGKTSTALRICGIFQKRCRNCYRIAKNVVDVPPPPEELAEDPDARWSASGECDCAAIGLFKIPPLPKEKGEKPKDYNARQKAFVEKMMVNSYEEVVGCWIDLEGSYDKEWAECLGVATRRVVYANPETAEEAIEIMCALLATVEIDFLALDSMAQLVPIKEIEESMEKWQQGLGARLNNKGVRKLISGGSSIRKANRAVSMIWINQIREKIGMMYGDPTTKPGGKGQEFASDVEIKFKKGKVETMSEQFGSTKEEVHEVPIKEEIRFVNTKNRTAGMKEADGSYTQCMRSNDVYKKGDVMEEDYLFKCMTTFLLVQDKKLGTYTVLDKVFDSQKAMKVALREDPEFTQKIREALMQHFMGEEEKRKTDSTVVTEEAETEEVES